MKKYIIIIIYLLFYINTQAQWVLEGPTPYTINQIYGSGNNILNIMHNGDTVLIKKGSGTYQILKQKNGDVTYFIRNSLTGYRCRAILGGMGILEKTIDGGYNWTLVCSNKIFFNYTSMSFVNDTTGYFLTWMFDDTCKDKTIYDSKLVISKYYNGMITELFTECTNSYTVGSIYFANDSIGFFTSDFEDSLGIQHTSELRKSINGGRNWQFDCFWSKYDTMNPGLNLFVPVKIIENVIVVNSYTNYYLSSDWGNTWEKRSNDYTFYEFLDTIRAWGMYKYGQTLYFTKDRGKTWFIDSSLKNNDWNYFKCSSNEFCYTRRYFADQDYSDPYYYYVNYKPLTSVKENKEIIKDERKITIYSNNSALTFVLNGAVNENIVFSLFTIDGKLLLIDKLKTDKNGNLSYNFPLINFVKGIYLASFSFQGKNVTKKIIVQ